MPPRQDPPSSSLELELSPANPPRPTPYTSPSLSASAPSQNGSEHIPETASLLVWDASNSSFSKTLSSHQILVSNGYASAIPNLRQELADELPLLPRLGSDSKQFRSQRVNEPPGAKVGSAVFNLATTIIGAGIMALPATMKVLGLPLGLIMILVMGLLSEASIEMLIFFSTQMKAWTYGETVQGACGSIGRALAEISIIINNSGILIVYVIILGDVMSGSSDHTGLFEQWAGGKVGWWTDRRLVLFLTMVFVLAPLAFLKRIDSLRFSSALSVALAVLFVLLSSGIAVAKLAKAELRKPRLLPDLGSKQALLDLLVVIPIMTNAFICHFNVQPIYSELQERTPANMNRVGRISTVLCVIVYSMTAVSGYLLFGDSTASDVLINFDKDLGIRYSSFLNGVIRVGYVIHLMLVFPVIHFSLRQTVDSFFFPRARPLADSNARFVLLNVLLLSLTYLGSTLIPNIWIAFQFTGATTGLALGFMFPALVGLRWRGGESRRRSIIVVASWAMLSMAVVVSLIGVAGNVINLATGIHNNNNNNNNK